MRSDFFPLTPRLNTLPVYALACLCCGKERMNRTQSDFFINDRPDFDQFSIDDSNITADFFFYCLNKYPESNTIPIEMNG